MDRDVSTRSLELVAVHGAPGIPLSSWVDIDQNMGTQLGGSVGFQWQFMGNVWQIYGNFMANLWEMYGKLMGKCMGNWWGIDGKLMAN